MFFFLSEMCFVNANCLSTIIRQQLVVRNIFSFQFINNIVVIALHRRNTPDKIYLFNKSEGQKNKNTSHHDKYVSFLLS